MRYFLGLIEGVSISLNVGLVVGQKMVGIGVVRGVEIFPWKDLPVSPNHVMAGYDPYT